MLIQGRYAQQNVERNVEQENRDNGQWVKRLIEDEQTEHGGETGKNKQ